MPNHKPFKIARASESRRGFAIRGYVGPNGHGKSLAMVLDAMPSLARGRPVLANLRLLDWENPRPCDDDSCTIEGHGSEGHMAAHPLYTPLVDYQQLLEWRHGDILLDEVTGVASSRESGNLPFQVVNTLVQLRRRDVGLSWTAPAWARCERVIRETTQAVILCGGMMPKKRESADGTAFWRDRRLFRFRTFDATLFDDFTTAKGRGDDARSPKSIGGQWFWRPGSAAERAYDTSDSVTALGWATESGLCMACGGKRYVRRCSCDDHKPAAGTDRGKPLEGVPVRNSRRARAALKVLDLDSDIS